MKHLGRPQILLDLCLGLGGWKLGKMQNIRVRGPEIYMSHQLQPLEIDTAPNCKLVTISFVKVRHLTQSFNISLWVRGPAQSSISRYL